MNNDHIAISTDMVGQITVKPYGAWMTIYSTLAQDDSTNIELLETIRGIASEMNCLRNDCRYVSFAQHRMEIPIKLTNHDGEFSIKEFAEKHFAETFTVETMSDYDKNSRLYKLMQKAIELLD